MIKTKEYNYIGKTNLGPFEKGQSYSLKKIQNMFFKSFNKTIVPFLSHSFMYQYQETKEEWKKLEAVIYSKVLILQQFENNNHEFDEVIKSIMINVLLGISEESSSSFKMSNFFNKIIDSNETLTISKNHEYKHSFLSNFDLEILYKNANSQFKIEQLSLATLFFKCIKDLELLNPSVNPIGLPENWENLFNYEGSEESFFNLALISKKDLVTTFINNEEDIENFNQYIKKIATKEFNRAITQANNVIFGNQTEYEEPYMLLEYEQMKSFDSFVFLGENSNNKDFFNDIVQLMKNYFYSPAIEQTGELSTFLNCFNILYPNQLNLFNPNSVYENIFSIHSEKNDRYVSILNIDKIMKNTNLFEMLNYSENTDAILMHFNIDIKDKLNFDKTISNMLEFQYKNFISDKNKIKIISVDGFRVVDKNKTFESAQNYLSYCSDIFQSIVPLFENLKAFDKDFQFESFIFVDDFDRPFHGIKIVSNKKVVEIVEENFKLLSLHSLDEAVEIINLKIDTFIMYDNISHQPSKTVKVRKF